MMEKIRSDDIIFFALILLTATVTFSTGIASVAVGIGAIFLIRKYLQKKRIPPEIDSEILRVFFVYLSLEFMIAFGSLDPIESFREFGGEIHRLLPIFFALISITSENRLKIFSIAFLISCLVSDCFAFYQHFELEMERAIGFAKNPNMLASFQMVQLPMAIFFATRKNFPIPIRILSTLISIEKLFVLIFTWTRGAWIALLICGIVFVILNRRALKFFGIALAIFGITFALDAKLQDRLETLSDLEFATTRERKLMWGSTLDIIVDYPLHGIGQSMFGRMYNSEYISPEAWERPDENGKGHTQPHNNFLKAASEGGILGLAGFVILHGYFFRRAWLIRREDRDSIQTGTILILLLLGIQIEGLTDTNLNQTPIVREYWLSIGTLLATAKLPNQIPNKLPNKISNSTPESDSEPNSE